MGTSARMNDARFGMPLTCRGGGTAQRRPLLISRGWVQAVLLVVLFGFFVLGLLAYRTYEEKAPIPDRVVGPTGQTIYTGQDVREGQKVFLNNGLMEYGSIYGHGAYLGPDFTADYLHRAALFVNRRYGGRSSDRAGADTRRDFTVNRYDEDTGTLRLSLRPGARRTRPWSGTTETSSASRPRRTDCARRRSPILSRSAS